MIQEGEEEKQHSVACSDIHSDLALLTSLHLVTSAQKACTRACARMCVCWGGGILQQRSSPLFVRKQSDELDI